ncbi:MAG: zeta toxin family protein [bacterium]|nr:zeta toxin family protein [bacterium]
MDYNAIQFAAITFARKNRKKIARKYTDINKYRPDKFPVSVFMAGSPGAGKIEFSKNIISILEKNKDHQVVRVDGDEIRHELPGYTGNNSYLFQGAISLVVEKIHDSVLAQKQSFVLDGTLSKYEKAAHNIKRSLDKGRQVFVFYVYQHPLTAWNFTKKREAVEGRNIPKESFIDQFLGARDTINSIRENFDGTVTIFLVKKDFEKNTVETVVEIKPHFLPIDEYIKERYTKDELNNML